MGSLGYAFGCRPDFHSTARCSCVYAAIDASAGRCGDRVAHSNGAGNFGLARGAAGGFVLFDRARAAMVCVGMALRRGCGEVRSVAGTEWGRMAYGSRDRGGIRGAISPTHRARNERSPHPGVGAARNNGVDDSFSGAPARGELAVHSCVVLDSRYFRAGWLRRGGT